MAGSSRKIPAICDSQMGRILRKIKVSFRATGALVADGSSSSEESFDNPARHSVFF